MAQKNRRRRESEVKKSRKDEEIRTDDIKNVKNYKKAFEVGIEDKKLKSITYDFFFK